jgi:hypothetical protein
MCGSHIPSPFEKGHYELNIMQELNILYSDSGQAVPQTLDHGISSILADFFHLKTGPAIGTKEAAQAVCQINWGLERFLYFELQLKGNTKMICKKLIDVDVRNRAYPMVLL